ncbi:MAG: HDIG domain-containing protein [Gemmatimonadetes bacterium]|nr:HDIG domain-containing protein [Gemmatimonadota bacterium]
MSRTGGRTAPVLRRAALAVDEAPESHWAARLLHHGSRVLLLVATAIAVYLFFPVQRLPDAAVLERGVVVPQDVVAEFAFAIPKSEAELLREREEAASGVPPVLAFIPTAEAGMIGGVRGLFAGMDSVLIVTPAAAQRDSLRAFLWRERISPTQGTVGRLLSAQERHALRLSIETAVGELYPRGVASPGISREGGSVFLVRDADGTERLLPRDSLIMPDRFFMHAAGRLPENVTPEGVELQRLILIRLFQPSLALDASATEAARARARDAVDPVRATVLQGEKIVGAREQIGAREEERLRAYQAALAERGLDEGVQSVGPAVGAVLYNALLLGILGTLLFFFRRPLYHDFRSVLLLALLVVAVTGSAALITRFALPVELIPVTFAALIVAALWDGRFALVLALVMALLIGGQSPFLGVSVPFSVALGGAAAALSVRVVHRRSRTWLFISIISLAYGVAAITMGLMRSRELSEVLTAMGWGAVNAVVASLLAIGFLPLLEAFARITTDQTLLELSDLNRRLLKRLSLEASGTYHHTINVANMAEAASHAIGANGLLARVGAYYHDIGKLVKPQYFIENQPRGRNPHDKLKPAMSASIIRSHVTEGLRMADAEGLPDVVKSFIAQHHGTQLISFFYDRAREADPEAHINPGDYAYPGPKPQTKETAVVMLADSIESAARVLQDPSADRLRELVERIVAVKIAGDQLQESPLTLRDIEVVKEHLVNVLGGMYHHRIDYPPQLAVPPGAPQREGEIAPAVDLASTT